MLALGAFRSAFHSRLRLLRFTSSILSNPHRRFLSTSHNRLRRPYTWSTRLWYRQDGTPRSKREGPIYVTFALLLCYSYNTMVDVITERKNVLYLIYVRRVNSYYKFDLSQPSDIVEYMCKLRQADFTPAGKEHGMVARAIFIHILKTFPEACTYIRSQLEELRDLTQNNDVNQDPLEISQAIREVDVRVWLVMMEKINNIHEGIHPIRGESQKSDAKHLYREIN